MRISPMEVQEVIMKRRLFPFFLLLVMFGLQTIAAPSADGQRRKPPRRTVVVVHRGFPIKRAPRNVVIHAIRRPYRIAPRLYLPLLTWGGVLVTTVPGRDLMVWEDGETLIQDEEWTEFTLNCENTGTNLWLEVVSGKVRFDWAEVVFGNGEAQAVEMQEFIRDPGYYLLLDFAAGREIDHVRMVAKSESPESRVVLKIQK
jgi:hypothetical protein